MLTLSCTLMGNQPQQIYIGVEAHEMVVVDEDVKRLVDTTTQELGDLYAVRSLNPCS